MSKFISYISANLVILILGLSLFSCGYIAKRSYYTELEDYNAIWELPGVSVNQDDNSLSVFPGSVDDMEVEAFLCRYDEQLPLGEGFQVFLRIKYDNEVFENELQRLKNEFTSDLNDSFQDLAYTAYVKCLGEAYSYYEYALVDETKKEITYVYLESLPKDEIEMDHKYLPNDYEDYGRE